MKILLYGLNYAPEPVGIGKYSAELVDWFAARGHQLQVVTAPPYFPGWRIAAPYRNRYLQEQRNGVRLKRCPLWVPHKPSGLTRLLHLASFALSSLFPLLATRHWKPDVVITVAPAFFCAPGALLLGRLCGRRCLLWLHIQDFELDAAFELGLLRGRLLRSLAETWERRTIQAFSSVSSISGAMLQRLQAKGLPPERIRLLPNWVDLRQIRPQHGAERNANPYRRRFAIQHDQIVLMYSGSMNKKQGLELLVSVMRQLSDCSRLVWLFAGEGPTRADLIAATAGLPRVHHLPLQPASSLNNWLNAADIHLLPQKAAAADLVLPSKLLGILASGRPVVAASPMGSELALLAGEAGRCVSPGDPDAFTTALRELINDPDQRAACGRRARCLAEERFGQDAVLQRLEQQLQQLHRELA